MKSETRVEDETDNRLPKCVAIILAIFALILPYWMLIELGYNPSFVMWAGTWIFKIYESAGTWHVYFSVIFIDSSLNVLGLLSTIAGPQLIFAYFMYRLYSGKTSAKKAFAIGGLGVIPPIFLTIPGLFIALVTPGYPYIYPIIPIPLTLFLGYALVKKYPPPETVPEWLQ
ncbi:MAG: hypothetical protein GF309_02095 [Candidatus Lokiarchaeota archaeon]|nr:hypothetical protein [Candidatus Lokiarchaeota archaeon]